MSSMRPANIGTGIWITVFIAACDPSGSDTWSSWGGGEEGATTEDEAPDGDSEDTGVPDDGGGTTSSDPSGGSFATAGGSTTSGGPSATTWGGQTSTTTSGNDSMAEGEDGGTTSWGDSSVGSPGDASDTGYKPPALHGERYPFPQNVTYPYGVQSNRISHEHVRNWYDSWSQKYLQACNGNLRPGADPLSTSLVEAQGFAMVAAAYMGDKPVVDQLYGYYQAKVTNAGCGLMGWKNNCQGWEDQGSATDGDIDVASGLLVAHWQWPNDGYDDKARGVLSNLTRLIANCGGTSALHPGCSGGRPWGGCNETDISYYSPAFFRHFADLTGDPAWAKLADDSHVVRDAAAHPSTGLVPDWQSVSGNAGAGSRKGYYSFDAIRTPYKHALDYLWHGNERARAWCEKITTWAYGVGVGNLRDGYQLDGSVAGSNHNLAVVGSLAVCAMANSQEVVDAFVQESVGLRDDYWYSGYLGNLYLLAMSGNMWNPDIVGD